MSYEPTVWVDGDHVTSAKLNKLEQGVNSMSYTPTVWNAGDVVTAEKLNKLEQGVAEGGGGGDYPTFKLEGTYPDIVASCDKTFAECSALLDGGVNVCLFDSYAVTEYPLMGGFMHWVSDEKTAIYGSFYDDMSVTYLQNGTVLPQ